MAVTWTPWNLEQRDGGAELHRRTGTITGSDFPGITLRVTPIVAWRVWETKPGRVSVYMSASADEETQILKRLAAGLARRAAEAGLMTAVTPDPKTEWRDLGMCDQVPS
jgi:hypothetical protein